MNREATVVIGMGEIGSALADVLANEYDVWVKDVDEAWTPWFWSEGRRSEKCPPLGCRVLHICFPYSSTFVHDTCAYIDAVKPEVTVIHSTVPVGTSRRCGAIHSPVIGRHPRLEESIRIFTKFLGGERASLVADHFRRCGINVYITDKQETTELAKILCTTTLGVLVEMAKETKRQFDKAGTPYDFWPIWTKEYNEGYARLGMPYVQRPSLVPIMTKTGGHCVRENAELLDSWMAQIVREKNGGL
ncbi:MAG: hypothetical protein WC565_05755 [Parcubacteria group bacterium]|nr:hypothetical protein [Methanoregula sp.]